MLLALNEAVPPETAVAPDNGQSMFLGLQGLDRRPGRNMAPFVELEWGSDAYQLMWQLKRLLDPNGILNPGKVLQER